jgi:hypothetical protein
MVPPVVELRPRKEFVFIEKMNLFVDSKLELVVGA